MFWIGILIALVTTGMSAKKGLYDTWTLLFNVIIAVYLSFTLGPVIQDLMGIEGKSGEVFVMFGTAVISLTILYGISYVIFLSQFNVTFPKIIDLAGGGILGFLTGLLIWSFIAFLICVSPLGQSKMLGKIGFNSNSLQSNASYMKWWTEVIHGIVSTEHKEQRVHQKINDLIEDTKKNIKTVRKAVEPNESEQQKKEITIEEKKIRPVDLGPPPELNTDDI